MPKERVERDEEDLVRLYLTDIGQYPLLTKEDEVRLAQKIEKGVEAREKLAIAEDLTAKEKSDLKRLDRNGARAEKKFVQSNLRLVVSIAKKYQASGLKIKIGKATLKYLNGCPTIFTGLYIQLNHLIILCFFD